MDNYKQVLEKLENRTSFQGNSMRASTGALGRYEVYSYNTLIACWSQGPLGFPWIDTKKYSVTTSRHQNLVRKAWAA